MEPGETPGQALSRELEEELGVRAVIGSEMARYPYVYPGRSPILLVFFAAELKGEPVNREFDAVEWAAKSELPRYDFLEGDRDFVARLSATG